MKKNHTRYFLISAIYVAISLIIYFLIRDKVDTSAFIIVYLIVTWPIQSFFERKYIRPNDDNKNDID